MKRKPNFFDMFNRGFDIERETIKNFPCRTKIFAEVISVLIELVFLGRKVSGGVESDKDVFHSYVWPDYCDLPSLFCACRLLMVHGYYSEALAHIRALLEKLIKNRYFSMYKEKLELYEKSMVPELKKEMTPEEKKKIKIPTKKVKMKNLDIKHMFDEVTGEKNVYEKIYEFLCGHVHKNYGSSSLMLNKLLNGRSHFILIPEFNKILAEYVFDWQLFLLYGYLNFVSSFFEYNWEGKEQLLSRYKKIKNVLSAHIIQGEKKDSEFYKWIRLIVEEKDHDWSC